MQTDPPRHSPSRTQLRVEHTSQNVGYTRASMLEHFDSNRIKTDRIVYVYDRRKWLVRASQLSTLTSILNIVKMVQVLVSFVCIIKIKTHTVL